VSRFGHLALIVVGGMVGTFVRAGLESALPVGAGQWPWTTFWINVSGSLALGILLELLAAGEDAGWRRSARLGVGTGVLGGYTTYSTFSVETVELLRSGNWLAGLAYPAASLLAGIAAAALAMVAIRRLRRLRETPCS
jgi:CrcB protein